MRTLLAIASFAGGLFVLGALQMRLQSTSALPRGTTSPHRATREKRSNASAQRTPIRQASTVDIRAGHKPSAPKAGEAGDSAPGRGATASYEAGATAGTNISG
jgi:hypothetical protein